MTTTLLEAKQMVREGRETGVPCPCCEQFCKVYKRRLSSSMARALIEIVKVQEKSPGVKWLHVHKILTEQKLGGSNDFALLRHWELVEEKPVDAMRDTGRTSGMWRVKPLGIAFARGLVPATSHIFLYNNRLEGFSDSEITIQEALGKKFNYQELMYAKQSIYS